MKLPHIELEIFDPNDCVFKLGLDLERYDEHDTEYKWVRRQFVIGLFVLAINISWKVNKEKI